MIDRRTFGKVFGAGAVGASLAGVLESTASAATLPGARHPGPPIQVPDSTTPLGAVKQIKAGDLDIGYFDVGPTDGTPVICHHGYPTDPFSFATTAPLLVAEGYRVIAPFVRGYGTTRFLSRHAFRNAQQSAVALDTIALMDALKIDKAVLAGFDWGTRTVDIIAALWPQRVKALVAVTGYLITNVESSMQPKQPEVEWLWWHQATFATEQGRLSLEKYRKEFARFIWDQSSPGWKFDEATFDRTAASFDNPDHVDIVIHNYRWRLGVAKGEARYDGIERRLAKRPVITVPTYTLDGATDPYTPPGNGSSYRAMFTGKYAHRTLEGVGAIPPLEAPEDFAETIIAADHL
jgi:pimeloyl-ACP methyl ester carboxylesterase